MADGLLERIQSLQAAGIIGRTGPGTKPPSMASGMAAPAAHSYTYQVGDGPGHVAPGRSLADPPMHTHPSISTGTHMPHVPPAPEPTPSFPVPPTPVHHAPPPHYAPAAQPAPPPHYAPAAQPAPTHQAPMQEAPGAPRPLQQSALIPIPTNQGTQWVRLYTSPDGGYFYEVIAAREIDPGLHDAVSRVMRALQS